MAEITLRTSATPPFLIFSALKFTALQDTLSIILNAPKIICKENIYLSEKISVGFMKEKN